MTERYDFKTVEKKWRPRWEAEDLYKTGSDPDKPSYYILDYFPYPSGAGLSLGHARNYVPTCISARYRRMRGYNVLHPMGWDAFGLPAENYAIEHDIHPRQSTEIFCSTYKRQMKLLECSYDWSREINSTDPDYYRWTQYFFLLLHRRGLAYQAVGNQWWCPSCQTILANEQVERGRCWRCNSEVTKKDLQQWYFKITDYADRLLADLETVDWPEPIKMMQRNWIGRSEGAEVVFPVPSQTSEVWQTSEVSIKTFTTRLDTLFGVTFIALAPEHPLVAQITTPEQQTAVTNYVRQAQRLSDVERQAAVQEKSGVFTGAHAVHPLTGDLIPIWVADYVLPGVGTGAVMGVPGHDERDGAFAQQYDLPIVTVIRPDDEANSGDDPFTGAGTLINSGPYSGLASEEAIVRIMTDLATQNKGQAQVTYKLRDWLISRQRYWGAPIPIIHCPDCGAVPVPETDLPVRLPDTNDFAPAGDGRSPLARVESWVNTTCPQCGQPAQRETDTMDGFACSSWYFLRFASPHETERPFDPEAVARWLPVDSYVGGAEHAVMHLLYARFWTKVMVDAGMIDFFEPFAQLRNQGMLLSPLDGQKMSKSKGNVITPDEVIAEHGTDALRLAVVFLGPFDQDVMWDDAGIRGMTRFLERYWRLANSVFNAEAQACAERSRSRRREQFDEGFERGRHRFIQRMTRDLEEFRFNTAVAALMEYQNTLSDTITNVSAAQQRQAIETFTLLLAPFAPFVTEEVWRTVLGQSESVHRQPWPDYDEALTVADEVTVVVQVNGRLRDRITVPRDVDQAVLQETAVAAPNVHRFVNGRAIRNVIIIPNKLVNIVVN